MRWEAHHRNRRFVIEGDLSDVGFYLFVYEGARCTNDYLQDTVEMCKAFAAEEFEVPTQAWSLLEPQP